MHQALKARDDVRHAEEAQQEAEARVDEQLRREREERDHRRRLAEIRAALPEDTLDALRRRAEEELAHEGVAPTQLGYDVLVKLKLDELLLKERGMGGHSGHESAPDALILEVAGEETDHEGL